MLLSKCWRSGDGTQVLPGRCIPQQPLGWESSGRREWTVHSEEPPIRSWQAAPTEVTIFSGFSLLSVPVGKLVAVME